MKKQIMLLKLIFSFLILNGQSNDRTVNELILQEDENVKITLHYFSKADIGDSDWLKMEIENKTDSEIQIVETNYYVNKEKELENGEKYVDIGEFGRGNKYDLIHYFFDLPNASDYRDGAIVNPNSRIFAWKYLTNYASVLIDGRNIEESNICGLFQLDFLYKIRGEEIKLVCDNKSFCFDWVKSELVEESKLETRLREIILNPHYQWVNTYVTSDLMGKQNIVKGISTEELIQGVLLRASVMNADENILFLTEIKRRGVSSNEILTSSFKKRIINRDGHVSSELQYYWDNALLNDLINSELSWHHVHRILEVNAKSWSSDSDNTKKVYEYLATSLNFEKTESLKQEEINQWANNVKLISTSRNIDFIKYLEKYLDNETEFTVEDWSKYRNSGMLPRGAKPDTITLRICDVAFVALLRAMNQFEFELSSKIGTKYHSMNLNDEILPKEMINNLRRNSLTNDINLGLFEKEIRLTPELKKKIKEKINTAANKG